MLRGINYCEDKREARPEVLAEFTHHRPDMLDKQGSQHGLTRLHLDTCHMCCFTCSKTHECCSCPKLAPTAPMPNLSPNQSTPNAWARRPCRSHCPAIPHIQEPQRSLCCRPPPRCLSSPLRRPPPPDVHSPGTDRPPPVRP